MAAPTSSDPSAQEPKAEVASPQPTSTKVAFSTPSTGGSNTTAPTTNALQTPSPKKSLFSVKKEVTEALAQAKKEPEHLPEEPFTLDTLLQHWQNVIDAVASRGNQVQASLMMQWKPLRVEQSKVILQAPSLTVEKMMRETLEPFLPEIKKSLQNFALELVFEIVEIKQAGDDEKKIPQHIRNFQFLTAKYPEVDKLRELFGLYPTEL
ncbi:hypothetical protein JCM31826_21930 [Thermaurantimonas aggregans]|uniref:DNA polymerase III subunit gamma/tau n=1 Tax=Thermaurantimonas aggregans TaxID=2173829 RepID=A0A401XNW6_9FLAO|nr:hypothetical protein [Thermaurantimonas aggregans]GCD78711.1 hypothetical protein JCM31826_21930 [Thermaurantimonas aggregans]